MDPSESQLPGLFRFTCDEESWWEGNDIYCLFFHYKHKCTRHSCQSGHADITNRDIPKDEIGIKTLKRAKTGDKSLNKFIMRRLWLLGGCKQAKGWAQKKFKHIGLMTNLKERQRSSGKLSWQPHRQVDVTLPASKCFQCLFSKSLKVPCIDRTDRLLSPFYRWASDVWHCDIFRLWVCGWSSFHDLKPFPKPKFVF